MPDALPVPFYFVPQPKVPVIVTIDKISGADHRYFMKSPVPVPPASVP